MKVLKSVINKIMQINNGKKCQIFTLNRVLLDIRLLQCLLSFYITKKKSFLQAKDVLEWMFHGNYVGP